jgi:nucleoside-diphosphate-sugar epimerase
MKIFLIGGNSLLARSLLPLLNSFAEVVTAGRSGCDVDFDLRWEKKRFNFPANVDIVVNLAASFGGTAEGDLELLLETNALGPYKLAQACVDAKIPRLVQISTIFSLLEESSEFYNGYALSKKIMEELLNFYSKKSGLKMTCLRPAQIYGGGEDSREHQPSIYRMLDQAQSGKDILIYGSNDALRNFMHVDDVAEVISRLIYMEIEGSYDCLSLSNIRLSEIGELALRAFGSDRTILFDDSQLDIPDNTFEISTTVFDKLGFMPRVTMEAGLLREAKLREDKL